MPISSRKLPTRSLLDGFAEGQFRSRARGKYLAPLPTQDLSLQEETRASKPPKTVFVTPTITTCTCRKCLAPVL